MHGQVCLDTRFASVSRTTARIETSRLLRMRFLHFTSLGPSYGTVLLCICSNGGKYLSIVIDMNMP